MHYLLFTYLYVLIVLTAIICIITPAVEAYFDVTYLQKKENNLETNKNI